MMLDEFLDKIRDFEIKLTKEMNDIMSMKITVDVMKLENYGKIQRELIDATSDYGGLMSHLHEILSIK